VDDQHEQPSAGPEPVLRRTSDQRESARASRAWWDAAAAGYQAEHGAFLGAVGFGWGPEGLREADARLLGEVEGRSVLEVGCGAGQCSRWLASEGAWPVGVDLAYAQLRESRRLDAATGSAVAVAVAEATELPFTDACFDLACSSHGAVPFVADTAALHREVARVLRPGGRWVYSVTHPVRWCFADDPGPSGLVASESYWDRRAYVEQDDDGVATYVEHHRTLGDHVREVVAAGLRLGDLVEPEGPEGHERGWGAWSPTRGRVIPGTAVFVCEKPG